MSIWGKIVGGVAGFALGGPLGALLGGLAGHAVDAYRGQEEGEQDASKSIAFTVAVIALGAKMAKADGVVSRNEVEAFKQVFRVPPAEMKNVARVFDQAKRDSAGFEPYAGQVARMFRDNPAVLEELLFCLAHIAKADGVMHPDEVRYLRRVNEIFGLDNSVFERVTEIQSAPEDEADPYRILGVARAADNEEIRRSYLKLVRENHPDRLTAQGMPEEFVGVANRKLAAINAAYERVAAERGIR